MLIAVFDILLRGGTASPEGWTASPENEFRHDSDTSLSVQNDPVITSAAFIGISLNINNFYYTLYFLNFSKILLEKWQIDIKANLKFDIYSSFIGLNICNYSDKWKSGIH
jgi:hypothetical protein